MVKVGCCGYPTSMKKYYEKFQLVEINRTFYAYPKMSTVAGWREKAPSDFEFTVKAHQGISHKFRFELEPSIKAFEQMKEICKTLKACILLIQTPGSLRPDKLGEAEKFLEKNRSRRLSRSLGDPWTLLGNAEHTGETSRNFARVGRTSRNRPF